MSFLQVKNRASSTLAADITATDTSLTVATGEGAKFPDSNFHITIDDEILLCTTRTGDTFTVVRAQEGTTAAPHSAGAKVELRITARIIQELQENKIDIPPDSTQGDILIRGATGWERLPAGIPGQVLKTQGAGQNPVWDKIEGVPTGTILPFAGTTIPEGFLECDGSAVSRTTYADLFNVIGTTFGAGDGATTFNLPNLKGKFIVGLNPADPDFDAINNQGGEKTHILTIDEMPNHYHQISSTGGVGDLAQAYGSTANNPNQYTKTTKVGGGQPHNNLPPFITLKFIIKT